MATALPFWNRIIRSGSAAPGSDLPASYLSVMRAPATAPSSRRNTNLRVAKKDCCTAMWCLGMKQCQHRGPPTFRKVARRRGRSSLKAPNTAAQPHHSAALSPTFWAIRQTVFNSSSLHSMIDLRECYTAPCLLACPHHTTAARNAT